MNIYLITATVTTGRDTFDAFVCCAASEADARLTHPSPGVVWSGSEWVNAFGRKVPHGWRDTPETVCVEMIGRAAEGVEPGVMLASFNAE